MRTTRFVFLTLTIVLIAFLSYIFTKIGNKRSDEERDYVASIIADSVVESMAGLPGKITKVRIVRENEAGTPRTLNRTKEIAQPRWKEPLLISTYERAAIRSGIIAMMKSEKGSFSRMCIDAIEMKYELKITTVPTLSGIVISAVSVDSHGRLVNDEHVLWNGSTIESVVRM